MEKLQVVHVTKSFGDNIIIRDVSIQLRSREIVCLLGASGGGKTTLFHIIAGLHQPDDGQVLLDGRDITGKPGQISYMLQKDLLLPERTIEDNVALAFLLQGVKKKEARRRVAAYFPEFGLEGTQKQYPHQLSGGMRQRAALLRTYMFSNDIALLDEPFSALDMMTKRSMHQWFLNLMEKIQMSALFITHDIDEALLLSDRIYLLRGHPGTITKELVLHEPKPRGGDFELSEEFRHYKSIILNELGL